jgi:DNA-binding NarL/FixJ family response regulator
MNDPIRLLLVGDDGMFAAGVASLLRDRAGIHVIGSVADAEEATGLCRARPPDVVLLDLDLPGLDGIEATRRILETCSSAKVVVVAELQSPQAIAAALSAGACGFVPRTPDPRDLFGVLCRAAAGEIVLPVVHLPDVVQQLEELGAGGGGASERSAVARLTARETEILAALAQGASTDEVADRLGISRMTVQSHVKSILAKLEVHSKVEAVTLAWRHGLVPISRIA